MQNLYRVVKDGRSFYVQPEMIGYYAENGYTIYKTVEEVVDNVEKEMDNYTPNTTSISIDIPKDGQNASD